MLDKECGNFCEYFSLTRRGSRTGGAVASGAGDARARLDALFSKK